MRNFYVSCKNSPFIGIFLGICSCWCIAFASLFISRIKSASPLLVTNIRMITQLLLSIPPLIYFSNEIIPLRIKRQRKLLIPLYIRCLAGTIGVTCLTFSLVYAPIADSSAISYTSPVYVAIFARVFLKEKLNPADCGLLFLAVIGVLFVTRPPFIFNFISNKLIEFDMGGNDPGDTHIFSSYLYYDHDKMHDLSSLPPHILKNDVEFSKALLKHFQTFHQNFTINTNNISISNFDIYNKTYFTTMNLSQNKSTTQLNNSNNISVLYPQRVLGLCFAVISSILTAVAMVTIRKINKLPFSTVLVNFSVVGILGTAILCAALNHYSLPDCLWSLDTIKLNSTSGLESLTNTTTKSFILFGKHYHFQRFNMERFYILGAAFLGTFGQFLLFLSLRFENAGVIAAVNSSTIVFTIFLQIIFQRKIPPWTSFVGSGIIIVAICLFGYRKWKIEKAKREAKLRRYSSAKVAASTQMHHSATVPALFGAGDGSDYGEGAEQTMLQRNGILVKELFVAGGSTANTQQHPHLTRTKSSTGSYKSLDEIFATIATRSTTGITLDQQHKTPQTIFDSYARPRGDDHQTQPLLTRGHSLLSERSEPSWRPSSFKLEHRQLRENPLYLNQLPIMEEEQNLQHTLTFGGNGNGNYNTIFSATDDTLLLPSALKLMRSSNRQGDVNDTSLVDVSDPNLVQTSKSYSTEESLGNESIDKLPTSNSKTNTLSPREPKARRRNRSDVGNSLAYSSNTFSSFLRRSSLHLSSLFGGGASGSRAGGMYDSFTRSNSVIKTDGVNCNASAGPQNINANSSRIINDLTNFDTDLLDIPDEPTDENQLTTSTVIVPQW